MKSTTKILGTVILGICIISAILIITPQAKSEEPVPILYERGMYYDTYQNPDGTFTTFISGQPKNYMDEGEWKTFMDNVKFERDGNNINISVKNKFWAYLEVTPLRYNTSYTWQQVFNAYPDLTYDINIRSGKTKVKFDLNFTTGSEIGEGLPDGSGLRLDLIESEGITYDDVSKEDDGIVFYNKFKLAIPESCQADINKTSITLNNLTKECLDPILSLTGGNVTQDGYIDCYHGVAPPWNPCSSYLRVYNGVSTPVGTSATAQFDRYRSYFEFNTSGIVDGTTILMVELNLSLATQTNGEDCGFYDMQYRPFNTSDNGTLFGDMLNGSIYNTTDGSWCTNAGNIGWNTFNLSLSAIQDLQNQLGSDWFALGVTTDETSWGAMDNGYIQTVESANDPELVVTYVGAEEPPPTEEAFPKAMVVYKSTDPYTAIYPNLWNGSEWSEQDPVNNTGVNWDHVRLESARDSNYSIMMWTDGGKDLHANVFNASSWVDSLSIELTTNVLTNSEDIEWMYDGNALLCWINDFAYNSIECIIFYRGNQTWSNEIQFPSINGEASDIRITCSNETDGGCLMRIGTQVSSYPVKFATFSGNNWTVQNEYSGSTASYTTIEGTSNNNASFFPYTKDSDIYGYLWNWTTMTSTDSYISPYIGYLYTTDSCGNNMSFLEIDNARDLRLYHSENNGANFTLAGTLGGNERNSNEPFKIRYSNDCSYLMMVYKDYDSIYPMHYRVYYPNNATLTGELDMTAGGISFYYMDMESNPYEDEMVAVTTDTARDVQAFVWDGGTWTQTELEVSSYYGTAPSVDYIANFTYGGDFPDVVKPVVNIINPTNNTFINGDEVVITSTATDNTEVLYGYMEYNYANRSGSWQNLTNINGSDCIDTAYPYECYINATDNSTYNNVSYIILAHAVDKAGNLGNSTEMTYTIDYDVPIVKNMTTNTSYPTYVINTTTINMTLNATDGSGAGLSYICANISEFNGTNECMNMTNMSEIIANDWSSWMLSIQLSGITETQTITSNVTSEDTLGNQRSGDIFYSNIDAELPYNSTSFGVSEDPIVKGNNLTIEIEIEDDVNLSSYSLYHNMSGSWDNDTNVSITGVFRHLTISKNMTDNGTFCFQINFTDSVGFMSTAGIDCVEVLPIEYGKFIDNITLMMPVNQNYTQDTIVNFTYAYNGTNPDCCALYLNSESVNSSCSITENQTEYFYQTNLVSGDYEWYIQCNDSIGRSNDTIQLGTGSWSFTLNETAYLNIDFTTSTPSNFTTENDSIYIETLASDTVDECNLTANGTNYSMATAGAKCIYNMTNLANLTTHYFFVTANGTNSVSNRTTDGRSITILVQNETPANIEWVNPTINGTESENITYIVWNISVSENIADCQIDINGTNQTATISNGTVNYCYYNETGLTGNQTRCAWGYARSNVTIWNSTSYICRNTLEQNDITPPEIDWQEPSSENKTLGENITYAVFNVSFNEDVGNCQFHVNGTWSAGTILADNRSCYYNDTTLSGNVTRCSDAYVSDTFNNTNQTNMTICISTNDQQPDVTPPIIASLISPPSNNSVMSENQTYILFDIGANENLDACLFDVNGTNQTGTLYNGNRNCYYNNTGLSGNVTRCAYLYFNDTAGNMNFTEYLCANTDEQQLNLTAPPIEWIPPTTENSTLAEGQKYIIWNISSTENIGLCKFHINGTNYTGTIDNGTTLSNCYYNNTGLTTNVTRCADAYAFDTLNMNVTNMTLCINNNVPYTAPPPGGGDEVGGGLFIVKECGNYTIASFVHESNSPVGYARYELQILNGNTSQRFWIKLDDEMNRYCFVTEQSNKETEKDTYANIVVECIIMNGTMVGSMDLRTDTGCNETLGISVTKSEGLASDTQETLDYLSKGDIEKVSAVITNIYGFEIPVLILIILAIIGFSAFIIYSLFGV